MIDKSESALKGFRAEIDAIDTEIVALLAKRMAVVDRVIAAKHTNGLPALIPARVEEVADHVRQCAGAVGIDPNLAEVVWRTMMDWVIAYEDQKLSQPGPADGVE